MSKYFIKPFDSFRVPVSAGLKAAWKAFFRDPVGLIMLLAFVGMIIFLCVWQKPIKTETGYIHYCVEELKK